MKRSLVLRRTAEREFSDAIEWYENQRKGLGKEFRLVIQQHFDRIAVNPEMFPLIRGQVRRTIIVRRFPFVIHFLIETERIVILSVFHTSRNPAQLTTRK